LTGLKTYTQYLVSLSVYNPEGDGPPTVVVVMTDEGGKKLARFVITKECSGQN
jgi:receptor-type tyrosine-protein phosphatase gamma